MNLAYLAATERAESVEHTLSLVTASPSWRLTAPLRALKRNLRRGKS
jgi:hypothetical protein